MKCTLAFAVLAMVLGAVGGAAATVGILSYTHYGGSAYFPDVSASSPHNQDIGWAAEYGVVGGYGDGTYHPNDPVTREQMATYIMRSSPMDIALTLLWVDYTYFDGWCFGETAYNNGWITYDDWVTFSDVYDWSSALVSYQASRARGDASSQPLERVRNRAVAVIRSTPRPTPR